MGTRRHRSISRSWLGAAFAASFAVTLGCDTDLESKPTDPETSGTGGDSNVSGTGGTAAGGTGAGGTGEGGTGAGGVGAGPGSLCSGDELSASKRVVRLTFNQQLNAFSLLLGEEFAGDLLDPLLGVRGTRHAASLPYLPIGKRVGCAYLSVSKEACSCGFSSLAPASPVRCWRTG